MFTMPQSEFVVQETPLLKECFQQLNEYFMRQRKIFTLPFLLNGTKFQIRVWSALFTIPYGETRSYGQVAKMCEQPRAARAVGLASNKNPLLILVPCHRVINCNGQLAGYAAGLSLKKYLLELEQQHL
jgi:methylated-DNA-[protein]-cysteine S-methyltransferase